MPTALGGASGEAGTIVALGGDGGTPPTACAEARADYSRLREELLGNYLSIRCEMNVDCMVMVEDNACAYACNVALPAVVAAIFLDTLNSFALERCSTCEPPEKTACVQAMPYCFVHGCVAFDVSGP